MKTGLIAYLGILIATLVLKYVVEIYWSATLALETPPFVPWVISIVWNGVLGGLAWIALRTWRLSARIALVSLIAILPHVLFEITHRSDPAYPYIGLILIVPDLLWVAVGAGIAALLVRRSMQVV